MVTVAVNNPVVAVAVAKPDDVPLYAICSGTEVRVAVQIAELVGATVASWLDLAVPVLDGSGAIVAIPKESTKKCWENRRVPCYSASQHSLH
jgi:hypothetical protein